MHLSYVLAQLVVLIFAGLLDGSYLSRGKGGEQRLHLLMLKPHLFDHSHQDLLEVRFRRLSSVALGILASSDDLLSSWSRFSFF
ncbi:hypothetical protein Aduo_012877 [Ancylostoma duodenale]